MVIGEAARASGVSAKMVRYYEEIGLIPAAARTAANYRQYGVRDVATLRFIRRARDLGLSVPRIRRLVGLWQDDARPSREVKQIALEYVDELQVKIAAMTALCHELTGLADACHGDEHPECPILHDLAGGAHQ